MRAIEKRLAAVESRLAMPSGDQPGTVFWQPDDGDPEAWASECARQAEGSGMDCLIAIFAKPADPKGPTA